MRQFITCSAESYILIWDLRRPPTEIVARPAAVAPTDDDDDVFEEGNEEEKEVVEEVKAKGWATIKTKKSTIVQSNLFSKDKKWTPAIGKYVPPR